MRKVVPVLSLFVFIFLLGFSNSIKAGNVSEAEQLIKQTLLGFAKAWNDKNANGVIAFYHEDAQIMTGADRRMVTRKQYLNIIPDRCRRFGKIKFGKPKIEIKDNKAKVNVKASFKRVSANFTFYMVLQDDRWVIMVQEY
ncbi:MAG: hypothetical protein DRH11_17915 [Deltaproteobacteria bacterium]|nr:MAG: hypothetical protein DRH11_17915 [Deltaproteobacteria bacterium]